jgi:hypothetical protein
LVVLVVLEEEDEDEEGDEEEEEEDEEGFVESLWESLEEGEVGSFGSAFVGSST